MFRYMISYTYTIPNGIGFGNCEFSCPRKIQSMNDVNGITTELRKQGFDGVTLLSFSEFASDTPKTSTTK